ncbi:MAG: carbon storage regulator [Gammaproteobacteria bacterium]|nr:carbon storage regulator [Gammaproteobacteria bacterium]
MFLRKKRKDKSPTLILTRNRGETVKIGDDIDVTLLGVKGSQATISIKAPRDVTIRRDEISRKVQQGKDET